MQRTLFISDLHLDASRPDITAAFLAFLEREALKSDALYILGDLFEAWIGDDYVDPLATTVSEALHSLAQQGVALYLMHGNRDFLIGADFCKRSACQLLDDPTVIDLYGTPTLLMHGDSLCTADLDYMEFRKMVRDPAMQAQLLALPVEQRTQIAKDLRAKSTEAMSNKAEDIMDVTASEVVSQMLAHNVGVLIHGHTHRPKVHSIDGEIKAKRIVLGDWDSHLWFAEASPAATELVSQALPA